MNVENEPWRMESMFASVRRLRTAVRVNWPDIIRNAISCNVTMNAWKFLLDSMRRDRGHDRVRTLLACLGFNDLEGLYVRSSDRLHCLDQEDRALRLHWRDFCFTQSSLDWNLP